MAFFQGSRGGNSRGDESSPIGLASPVSQEYQLPADPIEIEDWSDKSESSPEESHKKEGRVYWGKEENLQFASAWLECSNDPVLSLKNHWNKTIPFITKFNGCYDKAKREHGSGESDEQVMERTREAYKKLSRKKVPFALEYWWRAVKDQPKWSKAYPIEEMVNKRSRLDSSGAYTSSNQESEDADPAARRRPQEQNVAKAQLKGKGKSVYPKDSILNENVQHFNELQLRKAIAAEKMAEATLVNVEAKKTKAEADNKMAEAEKERARLQKVKPQ
uniref:No apical meristem-associated C-terminal domain-containing protein n=1 Tax=Setaria viridis TaxID=4556 RepID=A0A4U6VQZ1_SETVI|nr:hypothetical protein SEVIR_2G075300v2 [Setaria viridis]